MKRHACKKRFCTYIECEAMMCRFKWQVEWSREEEKKKKTWRRDGRNTMENKTEKKIILKIGKLNQIFKLD